MKLSHILGLNARTKLYSYPYNSWSGKKIARSKIQTARVLRNAAIPTPRIIKKFRDVNNIDEYEWENLHGAFVVKPSKGLGGAGILVVKKRLKNQTPTWITADKRRIQIPDLKLHVLDILEGAYSLGNVPDVAFIQEYVGRHKELQKYAFRGTPDIRVIVFNKVPVMAMLRLPTRDSGGRSNLHQGAIGAGVDIATGITTRATWYDEPVKYKPGTKRKLSGIKIPEWDRILDVAVRSQIASKLGYLGVDIVVHPDKGPMVMELNSMPGLRIQLANMIPLRKRLERVDDLDVRDAEHGVAIAKSLFAERFTDQLKAEKGIGILNSVEKVKVYAFGGKRSLVINTRIDTGAFRSSIDRELAEELGLLREENILWKDRYEYRSATGLQARPVVAVKFVLGGRKIVSSASVADRSKMSTKFLIGRNDMNGFLVNPEEQNAN